MRGQRNNRTIITLPAQQAGGRVAIHDWHLHIHQDGVEWLAVASGRESRLDSIFPFSILPVLDSPDLSPGFPQEAIIRP